VIHGRPVVPTGLASTNYPLALDETLLQQEQERTSIAVAARLFSYEVMLLVFCLIHCLEKKIHCPAAT
jgi:hypothetical protein